jgi:hypothetical protein
MDGRLNLSVMTTTPPGLIQPYRNVAGRFDLGWPYFGELMESVVSSAVSGGRDCLVLVTYHWSQGNSHRGCRGFDYQVDAAQVYTKSLRDQFERVFGKEHTIVYPIRVGIETDNDRLVLHGSGDEVLDVATLDASSEADILLKLEQLYPDMKRQMIHDLVPLILGNIQHSRKIRASQRPVADSEHREQILAIGRGFDWLHLPNKALIIGPFSYDLAEPVATAAAILWSNLKEKRISEADGLVLMASAVYREEAGPERFRAMEKAASLGRFALQTVEQNVPKLRDKLEVLAGTVNLNTRRFSRLPFEL